MTFSDGETLDIRFEETRRCKGLQRKLARQMRTNKARGEQTISKNMRKTQAFIRKEHLRQTYRKDNAAKQLVSGLKSCESIVTQDDSFATWKKKRTVRRKNGTSYHRRFGGRKVQSGILGRVKTRLNQMDNVILLPRNEKTTQYCDVCKTFTPHALDRRIYVCKQCGYTDQRDVHAAQNMLILASRSPEIPMERRNTLVESIASGYDTDFSALVAKRLMMKRETLKSSVSG
jgi:putative transposase